MECQNCQDTGVIIAIEIRDGRGTFHRTAHAPTAPRHLPFYFETLRCPCCTEAKEDWPF
jgi:hypothetical protein